MRPARRKMVAFLDDAGRQATLFDPFAAALRRHGLRTVRLTVGRPSLARRLRDRLFYSDVLDLEAAGAEQALAALFLRYDLVDVQFGEATLAELGLSSPIALELAAGALVCASTPPAGLFDKFELNATLAAAGVWAPPQMDASRSSAAAAAEALGLPLVVKRRVAEGGRGVRLAESPLEAESLLNCWRASRDEVFFQKHIQGELVMYGALFGDAGPIVERCFRATSLQSALGPSARLVAYEDPAVASAGRRIAAILGLRGLAQFDFIQDPEGRLWHIDTNARCWGSMMAASAQGADYLSAYRRLVSEGGRRPGDVAPGETEIEVQPFGLLSAAATGSWRALIAEWRDFARFCRRGPGAAYAGLIAVKAAHLLALRATARCAPARSG